MICKYEEVAHSDPNSTCRGLTAQKVRGVTSVGLLLALGLSSCVFELKPPLKDEPIVADPQPEPEPMQPEPAVEPEPGHPAPEADANPEPSPEPDAGELPDASEPDPPIEPDVDATPSPEAGAPPEPEPDPDASMVVCPDQKSCNGGCVETTATCPVLCEPTCDQLANVATSECGIGGQCLVLSCAPGFVDCDGEAANGCEADFNFTPPPDADAAPAAAPTLAVPRLNIDADPSAWSIAATWADIPMSSIRKPCLDCATVDDQVLPQPPLEKNLAPAADDLSAGFAMGWTDTSLYFRILLRDNDWVSTSAVGADARAYDNIEFLFDGDTALFGGDDRHLFISYAGTPFYKSFNGQVDTTQFISESTGSCLTLSGRLTRDFLGNSQPLPLALGAVYGFDIGINDYDTVPAEADAGLVIERQSHIFYRNPGNLYWYGSNQSGNRILPTLTLVEQLTSPTP